MGTLKSQRNGVIWGQAEHISELIEIGWNARPVRSAATQVILHSQA